jgi:hypothetical protein
MSFMTVIVLDGVWEWDISLQGNAHRRERSAWAEAHSTVLTTAEVWEA